MKANYGELSLQLRTAKSACGDGFAEARLRYGLQGDQQGTFVDLREAYVNAYLGPFDLRLGKQIIVWGRADVLNPTNNLTPGRLPHPLAASRTTAASATSARAPSCVSAPVRLEGVWMPTYRRHRAAAGRPAPVRGFGPPRFPIAGHSATASSPAASHLELAAFEMSVSYLHGYAPLPGLTLATASPSTWSTRRSPVSRTAYKQQVVGFDFSTALGERGDPPRRGRLPPPVRLPEPALRRPPRPAVRARRRPHLRLGQRDRPVPRPLRVRLAEGAGADAGHGRS